MLDVMRILKEAAGRGGRQPEFLSTHPLPETRLVEINAILKHDYPNGIPPGLGRGRPLQGSRFGGAQPPGEFPLIKQVARAR
jgi:hypothetical protein